MAKVAVNTIDVGGGTPANERKNTKNRQPVYYKQKDPKWKDAPFDSGGETIGSSGCGITTAAMIIETLTGNTFTPAQSETWAHKRYTTPHSGSYQSIMTSGLKEFNISSSATDISSGLNKVREGYYLACLMGDTYTGEHVYWSGHYVLLWWVDDTKVYVNDPNWTSKSYTEPSIEHFIKYVKKCWAVDARAYNNLGSVSHIDVPTAISTSSSATNEALAASNAKTLQQYQTVVNQNYNQYKGMDLFTSSSVIESPFIIAKIGDYTFGSYTRTGDLGKAGSSVKISFPNYVQSIDIIKTNGTLNVYTLQLVYQIVPGNDPNLLDKIFSTIRNSREITLSYGDWMNPAFIYREEQAIITKITSNINFQSQSITYTLSCTSKALAASAKTYHFDKSTNKKGSDIIKSLLSNKIYGLSDVFPAMADAQFVADNGLIPGDDKVITVEAKDTDPITYLNYVIASMSAATNNNTSTIKDSVYHLTINDDLGGAYFKVTKVGTSTRSITSTNIYEIDIGYPTSTLVTDFKLNTDNSWSILYEYNDKININHYVYSVGDDGQIYSDYVDSATGISTYLNRTTESNKTWWTQMTQFPITATLTIRGLLKPVLLMDYLRVNTYFYGQKHISSGLYVITKQEDKIDSNGYRTTLSLTRIAGDDDASNSISQTSIKASPKGISTTGSNTGSTNDNIHGKTIQID